MIDIQEIFSQLNQEESFRRIKDIDGPISVYCGIREANLPSIAFLTNNPPVVIESTQCIRVSQWEERDKTFWSRFDLQKSNARAIFYALCIDLIQSTEGAKDTTEAIYNVKNRYSIWRKMFKRPSTVMSVEEYQGLFGELYYLYYSLAPKVGIEGAIKAWSGAKRTAKDFSYDEDWFEVKTVTTGVSEIKISSLNQLEADNVGRLIVVRVERMAENYSDGHSSVDELINTIMNEVKDIAVKDDFMEKVTAYGYSADLDMSLFPRYCVKTIKTYLVDKSFPRITTKDIAHDEIIRVTYTLSINAIKKYMEASNGNN